MSDVLSHIRDHGVVGGLEALGPLNEPESLTQTVYAELRRAIVTKALSPGTVITEIAVARRLGVSKTPVREALLRLEAIGLVEPDSRRGLRIVVPSEANIANAFEVRSVLEAGLARLAVERATASERSEILVAANSSLAAAEAGDIGGFKSWDRRFHRAVACSARSDRLAELAGNAAALGSVLRERDAPDVNDAIRCAVQHRGIALAIEAGNPEVAVKEAEEHVADVREMVLEEFRRRARAGATVADGASGGIRPGTTVDLGGDGDRFTRN